MIYNCLALVQLDHSEKEYVIILMAKNLLCTPFIFSSIFLFFFCEPYSTIDFTKVLYTIFRHKAEYKLSTLPQ